MFVFFVYCLDLRQTKAASIESVIGCLNATIRNLNGQKLFLAHISILFSNFVDVRDMYATNVHIVFICRIRVLLPAKRRQRETIENICRSSISVRRIKNCEYANARMFRHRR